MDLIFNLARPDGYRQDQGDRFKVEFEKARGFYGEAASPFIAHLVDGAWKIEGDRPDRDTERRRRIRREVEEHVAANPGCSQRSIVDNVYGKATTIREVVEEMAEAGAIVKRDGGFYVA